MLDTFLFAFNAIVPIVVIIFLGYFLKWIKLLNDNFLNIANKLVFKVFLPCMLFYNIYSVESFDSIDWSIVVFVVSSIIITFVLGIIICKFAVKNNKQKGVVLQCIFRSNYAIIGMSLSEALGGASGLKVASVLMGFTIIPFNILSVFALMMFNKEAGVKPDYKKMLKSIVTNPLIIASVLGLIFLGFRELIPVNDQGNLVFSFSRDFPFIFSPIVTLSKAANPVALIVLGGKLNFSSIKSMIKPLVGATLARLVIVPAIALTIAILLSNYTSYFNFDKTVYPALVAIFGSPVAVSSAIMAREMDNDAELAGQLVVWTSILSIVSLFIIVLILRSMALL